MNVSEMGYTMIYRNNLNRKMMISHWIVRAAYFHSQPRLQWSEEMEHAILDSELMQRGPWHTMTTYCRILKHSSVSWRGHTIGAQKTGSHRRGNFAVPVPIRRDEPYPPGALRRGGEYSRPPGDLYGQMGQMGQRLPPYEVREAHHYPTPRPHHYQQHPQHPQQSASTASTSTSTASAHPPHPPHEAHPPHPAHSALQRIRIPHIHIQHMQRMQHNTQHICILIAILKPILNRIRQHIHQDIHQHILHILTIKLQLMWGTAPAIQPNLAKWSCTMWAQRCPDRPDLSIQEHLGSSWQPGNAAQLLGPARRRRQLFAAPGAPAPATPSAAPAVLAARQRCPARAQRPRRARHVDVETLWGCAASGPGLRGEPPRATCWAACWAARWAARWAAGRAATSSWISQRAAKCAKPVPSSEAEVLTQLELKLSQADALKIGWFEVGDSGTQDGRTAGAQGSSSGLEPGAQTAGLKTNTMRFDQIADEFLWIHSFLNLTPKQPWTVTVWPPPNRFFWHVLQSRQLWDLVDWVHQGPIPLSRTATAANSARRCNHFYELILHPLVKSQFQQHHITMSYCKESKDGDHVHPCFHHMGMGQHLVPKDWMIKHNLQHNAADHCVNSCSATM